MKTPVFVKDKFNNDIKLNDYIVYNDKNEFNLVIGEVINIENNNLIIKICYPIKYENYLIKNIDLNNDEFVGFKLKNNFNALQL